MRMLPPRPLRSVAVPGHSKLRMSRRTKIIQTSPVVEHCCARGRAHSGVAAEITDPDGGWPSPATAAPNWTSALANTHTSCRSNIAVPADGHAPALRRNPLTRTEGGRPRPQQRPTGRALWRIPTPPAGQTLLCPRTGTLRRGTRSHRPFLESPCLKCAFHVRPKCRW
jgi:hypothetical protein